MRKAIIVLSLVVFIFSGCVSAPIEPGYLGDELILAVETGDLTEVERLLINDGADVNSQDEDGNTALMEAAGNDHTEILEILKAAGADIEVNGWTALMYAALVGDLEEVERLIEAGADVNAQDNDGETALIRAAGGSCLTEITDILINAGSDLNIKDNRGMMAISWAHYYDCTETIVLLLSDGADENGLIYDLQE